MATRLSIKVGGADSAISKLSSIHTKWLLRLDSLQMIVVPILAEVLGEVVRVGKAITISTVAKSLAMEVTTTIITNHRSSTRNNTGSRLSILSLCMLVVEGELAGIGDISKAAVDTKTTHINNSTIGEVSKVVVKAVGVLETTVVTSQPAGDGAEEMAKVVSSNEAVFRSMINKNEPKQIKSSRKTSLKNCTSLELLKMWSQCGY